MKIYLTTALLAMSLVLGVAYGAEENANLAQGRRCNLQAREIALRISEQVSNRITAAERQQIAGIAEQVCLDYTGNRAMGRGQGQVQEEIDETVAGEVGDADEEDGGLFGGIKIIDRKDRVKRGGLKRP